jgi:hypothetical protein
MLAKIMRLSMLTMVACPSFQPELTPDINSLDYGASHLVTTKYVLAVTKSNR